MKKDESKSLLSLMSRKLRRVYDRIRHKLKEAGLNDLDITHGDILYQLYYNGDMTLKEMAEKIDRDKSTVTALVRKMEKLDLVQRYADTEDKRVAFLTLTEKGEGFRDTFVEISSNIFEKLYQNFSDDEKDELIRLLKKIV